MEPEDAPDLLTEADLERELGMFPLREEAGEGPGGLVEGNPGTRLVVPKKGKIFDADGVCEVVVIRPCVSRGKRIRNLPPIYTPQMLAENAHVYTGWLMYMDHLTERIVEEMLKEGRSIRELGGRVLKSWWDPSVRFKDDATFGFQPGGVAAKVLPQKPVREMLEADPEILNVSHNAWPTGARRGKAPWNQNLEGYLIEGIRPRPEGTVDWVPRGGAGGRLRLQEWEEFAVGVLGSHYGSASREDDPLKENTDTMDLSKITKPADLLEALKAEKPELAEALALREEEQPRGRSQAQVPENVLTAEALQEALREQAEEFNRKLEEKDTKIAEAAEEKAQSLFEERSQASLIAAKAGKLIEATGLPARWQEDLKRRYAVLPSGPSSALQACIEAEDTDTALAEAVKADAEHASALIEDAGGVPSVKGLGGKANQTVRETREQKRRRGAFREFLAESETDPEKKKKILEGEGVKEMVREGIEDVTLPTAVEG